MKPLAPTSEWIGVLIGIVVFGNFVGYVTASTPANCWKAVTKETKVEAMENAMKPADSSKVVCPASGSDKGLCLQYIAPAKALKAGKVELTIECGIKQCPGQNDINTKFAVAGYTCHPDCNAGSNCKTLVEIKNEATLCYEHEGKKLVSGTSLSQVYCFDGCAYFKYSADSNTGSKNPKGGVFMGCKVDCETFKSKPGITADGTVTACAVESTDSCKSEIVMTSPCWATTLTAVTTVKAITEAMSDTKSHDCGTGKKCLQYLPPGDTVKRKGKVHVEIGCIDAAASPLNKKFNEIDYTVHKCVRGTAEDCKNIAAIAGTVKCYDYKNEAKPTDFLNVDQVYCMDKCQYSIWTDSADSRRKKHFLGCAADCDKFKLDNSGAVCADCTNEEECKRMPDTGTGTGGTGTGGTGTATTRPTKHCIKVTGPIYLIGSMAILIYAVIHYMRQF